MKIRKQKFLFMLILLASLLINIGGCSGINEPRPTSEQAPKFFLINSFSEKSVQIGLQWSGCIDGKIKIERAIQGQPFQVIATIGCSSSSVIDSSLNPQNNYSYRAIAICTGGDSSSYSSTLTITYRASCTLLRTIKPEHEIDHSVLSYDGQWFITYCYDKYVYIWNTTDWSSTKLDVGINMGYNVIQISQNSELIILGGTSSIRIYRRSEGTLIRTINLDTVYIADLAITPAGDKLASADLKGNLHIWDINSGVMLRLLDEGLGQGSLAINPSDNSLVVCSDYFSHYSLNVWNIDKYTKIKYLGNGFYNPVFNSDGSILSVDVPHTYTKTNYSTKTWTPLYSYTSPEANNAYGATAFSPDDSLQILVDDNLIRVARVSNGEMLTSISSQGNYINYVAFFPDGMKILANSYYNIFVWSTPFKNQWVVANP
jgi:WD40 repeat protein